MNESVHPLLPPGAKIDPEDAAKLTCPWIIYFRRTKPYVIRWVKKNGKQTQIALHRELMGLGEYDGKVQVDHINGDSLDNRRCNLRLVNNAMNAQNRCKFRAKAGALGVYETRWGFRATAKKNGKTIGIGYYPTLAEAAKAGHEYRLANYPGYTGATYK